MNMIRLRRSPEVAISKFHFAFGGNIWALDTPKSRLSLSKLVDLGNAAYGPGSHWIEETCTGASIPPTPVERRSLNRSANPEAASNRA
jgi:hypothetical protein